MVKYVYDAWGKFLSTTGSLASTLGAIQPFRYRSYMYDQETGLYYLRSRYYNPVLCKFFCADIFICSGNVFDWNKYCYVNNNPVNRIDINGTTSSLAQPFWDFIKRDGMNYCLQDGVLLFGECIVLGAVGLGIFATLADGAVWLWNTIFPSTQSETVTLSSKIDWNSGDHNHIIPLHQQQGLLHNGVLLRRIGDTLKRSKYVGKTCSISKNCSRLRSTIRSA